jgi:hypothetical protein
MKIFGTINTQQGNILDRTEEILPFPSFSMTSVFHDIINQILTLHYKS